MVPTRRRPTPHAQDPSRQHPNPPPAGNALLCWRRASWPELPPPALSGSARARELNRALRRIICGPAAAASIGERNDALRRETLYEDRAEKRRRLHPVEWSQVPAATKDWRDHPAGTPLRACADVGGMDRFVGMCNSMKHALQKARIVQAGTAMLCCSFWTRVLRRRLRIAAFVKLLRREARARPRLRFRYAVPL
eukprot:s745_g2.t1